MVPPLFHWCYVGVLLVSWSVPLVFRVTFSCSAKVLGCSGVPCSVVSCSGVPGFIVCQFGWDCWQINFFIIIIFFIFILFFFFSCSKSIILSEAATSSLKKNDVIFAAMCFYLLQPKNVSKIYSGCSRRLKLHYIWLYSCNPLRKFQNFAK